MSNLKYHVPKKFALPEEKGKMKTWEKIVYWSFAILFVSYFGAHYIIYLIRLSAGQI